MGRQEQISIFKGRLYGEWPRSASSVQSRIGDIRTLITWFEAELNELDAYAVEIETISGTCLGLEKRQLSDENVREMNKMLDLKRPAENLNRWDSHGADFVIHPVWEDGSCQHHCRKRFVRGFRY